MASARIVSQLDAKATAPLAKLLGSIPNRLQLAGGWIDQPFVSRHNPKPPGSMVVVQIEPNFRPMDRSGIASGTRAIATKLWNGKLPNRPPGELVRELYEAENKGKAEPSGSQDMIGLIYPGINRLDYDFHVQGGVFPIAHRIAEQRPRRPLAGKVLASAARRTAADGYNPLGEKNLDPKWVARLGQSGQDCFDAIRRMDVKALGASLNLNMKCWETLLPHVVRHPLIKVDLMALLKAYQRQYPGAMYSGCGGGYLIVASNDRCPARSRSTSALPKMSSPKQVIVSGGFDDIRSRHLRFLEEAAKFGELTVLLWPDETLQQHTGKAAEVPAGRAALFSERRALRSRVIPAG